MTNFSSFICWHVWWPPLRSIPSARHPLICIASVWQYQLIAALCVYLMRELVSTFPADLTGCNGFFFLFFFFFFSRFFFTWFPSDRRARSVTFDLPSSHRRMPQANAKRPSSYRAREYKLKSVISNNTNNTIRTRCHSNQKRRGVWLVSLATNI